MRRLSAVLFAVGVLLALAALAAACGGGEDDRQALDEYFQNTQRITDQYVARFDALNNLYQQQLAASDNDDQRAQVFLVFLGTSSQAIRAEIDARNEIDPPPTAEKAHLEWLAAARVLAKVYEDVINRAADAQTARGLQQVLVEVDYESRLAEASDRAEQACVGLQDIADKNEIDVNLCPKADEQ
jgi:hypothetical protein